MKRFAAALLAVGAAMPLCGAVSQVGAPQLFCHRTANEDMPENTLDSLEQAALLGCNTVEIDLRRTLDGEIVLNHDGILERLTDGVGEVKDSDYATLMQLDMGSWMSPRFAGMHMARFEDALRIARSYKIHLVLDIKDKGIGAEVLRILDQEGMREQVQFGGEWEEIKKLAPSARSPGDGAVWVQPGVGADVVREYHRADKFVVVNFSANDHGMDLFAMKAAVAAGVDAINVDYPRLGADAVGRPIEEKLHGLILKAETGDSGSRAQSILALAHYEGFPLEEHFVRWLLDADPRVSRAAAEALVMERPHPDLAILAAALQSPEPAVRAHAAWALSLLDTSESMLLPLLNDKDPSVLQAVLLAVARTPGEVSAATLLPLLVNTNQGVRGAAARALAMHQPSIAVKAIAAQLDKEVFAERTLYDDRQRRGNPAFTQSEIDVIMRSFRCQMEMVRALYSIPGDEATRALVRLALRPEEDFSQYNAIVSGFQLWDRIALDPQPLIDVLGSENISLAERAEWTLTHAGPRVLPAIRAALQSSNVAARMRAMHILAWQADQASLGALQMIAASKSSDAALAAWAIAKIKNLHSTQ
jgi:glycerophosphoryl diester phosphodiesterase/HEAT repeat protein